MKVKKENIFYSSLYIFGAFTAKFRFLGTNTGEHADQLLKTLRMILNKMYIQHQKLVHILSPLFTDQNAQSAMKGRENDLSELQKDAEQKQQTRVMLCFMELNRLTIIRTGRSLIFSFLAFAMQHPLIYQKLDSVKYLSILKRFKFAAEHEQQAFCAKYFDDPNESQSNGSSKKFHRKNSNFRTQTNKYKKWFENESCALTDPICSFGNEGPVKWYPLLDGIFRVKNIEKHTWLYEKRKLS